MAAEPEVDSASPTRPIVFFDGVCGLCNTWIDFVVRRDPAGHIRFAPLQGETAGRILPGGSQPDPETVLLWDGQILRDRSDAISQTLRVLPGVWHIIGRFLQLIPRFLRDGGYRVIARNRYRWFGKKETCRMPTPAERARFLP